MLLRNANGYVAQLAVAAKQHHSTIILGVPIEKNQKYYNGLIAIGEGHGEYAKQHLVPFGEYLPFEKYLRGIIGFFNLPMSDFSAAAKQTYLNANGIRIAPFICYEIAYPALVLQAAANSQLLITLSDDSWFGRSIAMAQHLQIAQQRALETGRYLLFVSNSGITAIINPKGGVQASIPAFRVGVLDGKITAMQGITPIVWLGDRVIVIMLFLLLLLAWFYCRKT